MLRRALYRFQIYATVPLGAGPSVLSKSSNDSHDQDTFRVYCITSPNFTFGFEDLPVAGCTLEEHLPSPENRFR